MNHAALGMDLTFHSFRHPSIKLPEPLKPLEHIAMNFYWSWHPEGEELFRDLDPVMWEKVGQHPQKLLSEVSELLLWEKATDADYLARLAAFDRKFQTYLSASDGFAQHPESVPAEASVAPIAYFCAEYGVHNSLPIYSGGLGILAGDHLKSASDLNVPLVAVGLLYRYGYFRQDISHDGWQEEHYTNIFGLGLAIEPVVGKDNERVKVMVRIRGREVYAQAWLAAIGRIRLYLLDTNIDDNHEIDRMITGHLYGGDTETRIVQEKVLGIGGVRLLRSLDIAPTVFHLNEGHSAFLTLELAKEFLEVNPGASFEVAIRIVRQQCVFTTHTPVSAGNDRFSPAQLDECFDDNYLQALKLSKDEFFDLGRVDPNNDEEWFGMTPLALRMCRSANGVSKKHGEISRELWKDLDLVLHGHRLEDGRHSGPDITYITNGVHPPTWVAPILQTIFQRTIGEDWASLTHDADRWAEHVQRIDDGELWRAHVALKNLLIAFIRERTKRRDTGGYDTINERTDTSHLFSADALTIGFARRVAQYKRWNLILSDTERLLKMVDREDRPVQFVFAGKAHPQDRTAKQILQDLMRINHDSSWQRRAVFLEDHDHEVARYLVHGVDVWLNVPRRPFEASGTSGMKAAMNGVLNCSILDGWWIEGYNGENGFVVGDLAEFENDEQADVAEAEALYRTLERQIVPTFYERDEQGLPTDWIRKMKNSIASITPQFSSDRMVTEYLSKIYRQ